MSFKIQIIVSMLELKVKTYNLVKIGQLGTLTSKDASLKIELSLAYSCYMSPK